jgi:general secretion pathway protein L
MIAPFVHWWFDQLAGLVPPSWRDLGRARSDRLVLSEATGGCDAAIIRKDRRKDASHTLGRFACTDEGGRNLRTALGEDDGRPLSVVLAVQAQHVLSKTLSLPLAARRNVAQVIEFEIDHETPFRSDDVVWRHDVRQIDHAREKIEVELQLVPRQAIADGCRLLAAAGLRLDCVEIPGGAAQRRIELKHAAPSDGTGRRLQLAWGAAAAILAIVAVATPFIRVEHAVSAAKSDVERLRKVAGEAVSLKREIDEVSKGARFTADQRLRVRDPLRVMAAATDALPDGTHLTEFALRGEQATLVGLSPSAANLISALAAVPPFHDPAFGAAVVRPDGASLELFTIKARLDPTNTARIR